MSAHSTTNSDLHVFREIPFDATADGVLRAMKIRKVSASLSRLADDLVARSREVARPKALCRVAYIDERTDLGVTIGSQAFTSHVLRQNLEGIQRVFPFVATCGTELEGLLQNRTDIMESYCLDTIMMLALEAARRHVEKFIKDRYSVGQMSRMQPGSLKDWPIEEQRPLFTLLGDVHEHIGVRLSDHYLMTPIKSVSGIFFPTEVRFESCQLCDRANCPGRRSPHDATLSAKYGV